MKATLWTRLDLDIVVFQCMELKSIDVDYVGELVKLVLYQNHINSRNLYNQASVELLAVA